MRTLTLLLGLSACVGSIGTREKGDSTASGDTAPKGDRLGDGRGDSAGDRIGDDAGDPGVGDPGTGTGDTDCDVVAAEDCGDEADNDCDGATDADDTECPSHYRGFGSGAVGGAGGAILWVDGSLGDPSADSRACSYDDPCSLRKALLAEIPRLVRVKVGGEITLTANLRLRDEHSYLTFDGASAPAPGITLRGNYNLSIVPRAANAAPEVHNIIINHLRYVVTGDNAGITLDGQEGHVHDVVLDHITWTSTARTTESPKMVIWYAGDDITISNCLFYDSYKGLQISGMQGAKVEPEINGVSVFNNVFFAVSHRQPIMRSHVSNVDLINNIMMDFTFTHASDTVTRIRNRADEHKVNDINIINNVYESVHSDNDEQLRAIIYGETHGPADDGGPATCPTQGQLVTTSDMGNLWVSGNLLPAQTCDRYSTVPSPISRPPAAQISPVAAAQLCTQLTNRVGMRHHNTRENEIFTRMASGCL